MKRQFGSYYRKALRVIDSCETTTQLHGAKNFTEFVINSVPTYAKDDEYYRLCSRLRQKITKKNVKISKMTEEDIKYRQGRSRKQAEDTYKLLFISLIGMITVFIIAAFIG